MSENNQKECIDCRDTFVFEGQEKRFFEEKNLEPPKRCKKCRQIRKQERDRQSGGYSSKGGQQRNFKN